MKFIFNYFILFLPFTTLAQSNCIITIKISTPSVKGKASVVVMDKIDSISFSDSYIEFKELIKEDKVTRVTINYSGSGTNRTADVFNIYLTPGQTNINISPLDSIFSIGLTGPQMAVDYLEKLRKPVDFYNSQIRQIRTQFQNEKKKLQPDTLLINNLSGRLTASVKLCFGIPQAYIKNHNDSPLSLTALNMLGNGTKGTPITVADLNSLFNSLSDNIKNSAEGLKYQQKLDYLNTQR